MVQAWKMLHDPQVTGHLNTEDYMKLCRDAGYDKETVEKWGNNWANRRLDANLEP